MHLLKFQTMSIGAVSFIIGKHMFQQCRIPLLFNMPEFCLFILLCYKQQVLTNSLTFVGFHVDDAEVTLNVCLGKQFSGGELFFRGMRCDKHVHTESISEVSHGDGINNIKLDG